MEDSLSTNNLVRVVVSVLLAVIMVGVVMMPIISGLAEDKEVTNTLTNTGTPFALANADSESHPIIMSVDGDKLIVTSDGSPVSTGLGNVLPTVWTPYDTSVGPFNTYYVALNLADGDNEDDEHEERLSKVKGEIAYYLDADNLRQTVNGYKFTPSLYNVMIVIPPVYWYSEMDAPTEENPTPTTGKLYMASSPDAFVSMGISASNMKDYAHTYTDRSDSANPVVGHSPAIMISYYWGGYDRESRQYYSQSDRGTSISGDLSTITSTLANSNNGVTYGVYENENFSQWTLFKMMGWTVMGTMDSKSMMGKPITLGNTVLSGSVATAYHKAENGGSNALFVEDPYARASSRLGDISFPTTDSSINAGNTLGGESNSADVVNTLDTELYFPSDTGGFITEIHSESDVFGFPKATGSSSFMNERIYRQSNTPCVIGSSTYNLDTDMIGLGSAVLTGWNYNSGTFGLRFAYVVTDSSFTVPDGADKDYAYIMSYNTNGSIQDVQSIEDDVATSYMPTGTTLNSYWNFEDGYYTFPQLSEATNSVDLAVGSDSILQFYNSGHVVLQTANGTVDLGRVNDVTPTPVTVTVQNGVMTYTEADSTVGTVNVLLYKANEGDYVYGQNVKLLNDLSQGNVYVGQYQYGVTTANGTKDIGAIGTFTSQTETVGEGEDATEVTTVVPNVALFNTANVSTSTVTSSITQGQYYATINSISIATEFSDSDSVDYTVTGFYAPKTQTYVTIEQGGGLAYDILLYLPVLILVSVIAFIGYATLRPDSEFVQSLKSRF